MKKKPAPVLELHFGTGATAAEARANLIKSHDSAKAPLPEGFTTAGIKLYPLGKAYAWADAPASHEAAIHKALVASLMIAAYIDREVFRDAARSAGVPESVVDAALASARVKDDVYLGRSERET